MIEDGSCVEQSLCRMLMRTVSRIDDRRLQVAGKKMRGTRSRMPHDNGVRPHRHQRVERVHQRFAFRYAGGLRLYRHGFGTEPACRNLEADTSSCRRFEEQVYYTPPAERVKAVKCLVGWRLKVPRPVENGLDLRPRQLVYSE